MKESLILMSRNRTDSTSSTDTVSPGKGYPLLTRSLKRTNIGDTVGTEPNSSLNGASRVKTLELEAAGSPFCTDESEKTKITAPTVVTLPQQTHAETPDADHTSIFNGTFNVPDCVPFTFHASLPSSTSSKSSHAASFDATFSDLDKPQKRQLQRTKSLADISASSFAEPVLTWPPPPGFTEIGTSRTSGSAVTNFLKHSLSEATLDESPGTSSAIPFPSKSNANNFEDSSSCDTRIQDCNPFLASPRLSSSSNTMFPSLSTVIDSLLDDNNGSFRPKLDSSGCAVLPTSEFMLTLKTGHNSHYEFWDGQEDTYFCFPVDLTLELEPSRARMYEFYALAVPPILKVAVRCTSTVLPTRFTRLHPKPPNNPENNSDSCDIQPNQIYTTSYQGCVIASQKTEIVPMRGIYLSSTWARTSPPPKRDGSGPPEPNKETDWKSSRRGFSLRAWIPVPLNLFVNRETCTFRIDARVWIDDRRASNEHRSGTETRSRSYLQELGKGGTKWEVGSISGGDQTKSYADGEDEKVLETWRIVTVTHLQRGREML
ncbi:hypothetical protein AX17_000569 [Amanita inopinata Kibby_2008]|nr:hypothetical protein AX17_000569 [Amanita inopinata Kibby_2008]